MNVAKYLLLLFATALLLISVNSHNKVRNRTANWLSRRERTKKMLSWVLYNIRQDDVVCFDWKKGPLAKKISEMQAGESQASNVKLY